MQSYQQAPLRRCTVRRIVLFDMNELKAEMFIESRVMGQQSTMVVVISVVRCRSLSCAQHLSIFFPHPVCVSYLVTIFFGTTGMQSPQNRLGYINNPSGIDQSTSGNDILTMTVSEEAYKACLHHRGGIIYAELLASSIAKMYRASYSSLRYE